LILGSTPPVGNLLGGGKGKKATPLRKFKVHPLRKERDESRKSADQGPRSGNNREGPSKRTDGFSCGRGRQKEKTDSVEEKRGKCRSPLGGDRVFPGHEEEGEGPSRGGRVDALLSSRGSTCKRGL